MSTKKTVLIFGISSFLGSSIAERLKKNYRVVGTYYNTPVNISGVLTLKCDVTEKDHAERIVYLFKPDITIYAVGLTNLSQCQEFPKVADALNTVGVFNVSHASERYKSKFVYFSSVFVFSGEDTIFIESDTPTPSSVYGKTVTSSEFYIQKSCLNYIIFRCVPLVGRSYKANDLSWMEVVERSNFLGNRIVCDNKVFHGFLDVDTVCEILDLSLQDDVTNRLFQLSSYDICNRYQFTKKYMEKFGGNTTLVQSGDWGFPRTENQIALQNVGEELKFNLDVSNVENYFDIDMPTVDEVIEKLFKTYSGKTKALRSGSTGVSFI